MCLSLVFVPFFTQIAFFFQVVRVFSLMFFRASEAKNAIHFGWLTVQVNAAERHFHSRII